ncbi:MAG TPA: outer membrane protein transport protein, partial [Anaeromyxobacteraceae bacterium]|nr:outer membrane protein transport protein [Anaeromyxobacteraceae bacterium]
AGLPDDGTAIYYNPAGLTAIPEKLTLELDSSFIWQPSTFLRAADGSTGYGEIDNGSGMFYSPFFVVTYKATDRLALAAGVHGPPSNGRLEYPDPLGAPASQFNRIAPQRYMLIERDVLVAYPGLAAAYRLTDWLSLGLNLQLVYGSYEFTQNIVGGQSGDQRVTVDTSGIAAVTGILGATVRLAEGMHLGASWRPRYENRTEGTIRVRPYADVPFEQIGEDIEFTVPFPDVIRVGLDWRSGLLRLATDFVYETYSVVDQLEIREQEDIRFVAAGTPVDFPGTRTIDRFWDDSWSIRIGGEYGALRFGRVSVTPRLGGLYEKGAIPEDRTDVSFPNWDRFTANAGVTIGFDRYELTAAYTHIFQPERDVDDSTVVAPESPIYNGDPVTVGNGTFDGAYDIVIVGLRATFDGQ